MDILIKEILMSILAIAIIVGVFYGLYHLGVNMISEGLYAN